MSGLRRTSSCLGRRALGLGQRPCTRAAGPRDLRGSLNAALDQRAAFVFGTFQRDLFRIALVIGHPLALHPQKAVGTTNCRRRIAKCCDPSYTGRWSPSGGHRRARVPCLRPRHSRTGIGGLPGIGVRPEGPTHRPLGSVRRPWLHSQRRRSGHSDLWEPDGVCRSRALIPAHRQGSVPFRTGLISEDPCRAPGALGVFAGSPTAVRALWAFHALIPAASGNTRIPWQTVTRGASKANEMEPLEMQPICQLPTPASPPALTFTIQTPASALITP